MLVSVRESGSVFVVGWCCCDSCLLMCFVLMFGQRLDRLARVFHGADHSHDRLPSGLTALLYTVLVAVQGTLQQNMLVASAPAF